MILWIPTLLLGIALVAIFGLRGVRSGTSPHCRKCAYDLAGIDAPAACPECGRDLTAARAIRVGRLRRRPVLASVGVVLVLSGLGVAGYRFVLTTKNLPVAQRPTWLLKIDARSDMDLRADEAIVELGVRYDRGELGDEEYAAFIDVALEHQSDFAYSWYGSPWPGVLIRCHNADLFTDTQRQVYRAGVMTGVELLLFDEEVRLSKTVALTVYESVVLIFSGTPRHVFDELLTVVCYPERVSGRDGEITQRPRRAGSDDSWWTWASANRWNMAWSTRPLGGVRGPYEIDRELPYFSVPVSSAGEHRFDVTMRAEVYLSEPQIGASVTYHPPTLPGAPIWDASIETTLDIYIPGRASDVLRFADSTTGDPVPHLDPWMYGTQGEGTPWKIEPANKEGWLTVSGAIGRTYLADDEAYIGASVEFVIDDVRVTLLRGTGGQGPATFTFNALPNSAGGSQAQLIGGVVRAKELPRVDRIDVVLVPNPDIVVSDERAQVFWNEEFLFENIELDWSALDGNE